MLAQSEVPLNPRHPQHFCSLDIETTPLLPTTPPISPPTIFTSKTTPPNLSIITDPHQLPLPQDRPRLGTAPAPWERRVSQRQKQLEYGYNTIGYQNYIAKVPRSQRSRKDPQTPDKNQQCSTRSWTGQIKRWRRKLHEWDNPANPHSADARSASDPCVSDSKSWDSYSSIDSEKASMAASEWLDQVSDTDVSQTQERVGLSKALFVDDDIYRFSTLGHYEEEHFHRS